MELPNKRCLQEGDGQGKRSQGRSACNDEDCHSLVMLRVKKRRKTGGRFAADAKQFESVNCSAARKERKKKGKTCANHAGEKVFLSIFWESLKGGEMTWEEKRTRDGGSDGNL